MKSIYTSLITILLCLLAQNIFSQSITTGTVPATTICAGSNVVVPYTKTGIFTSSNVFTAQLSNSSGSFASPVTIGTLTSNTNGVILTTIPLSTITGTNYRIRVIGSSPAITGSPNINGLITINDTTNINLSISSNVVLSNACTNSPITLTANVSNAGTAQTFLWKKNATTVGTNSSNYTNSSWVDGDVVSCNVTSNATCQYPAPASSSIVMNFENTNANTWKQRAEIPIGSLKSQAGFTINNKIYIGTGFSGVNSSGPKKEMWEYDPKLDVWTQIADYPIPIISASGFSIGNRGFLGFGTNPGITTIYKSLGEYIVSSNTWVQRASLPGNNTYRAEAVAFSIGDYGYVACGRAISGSDLNDLWQYNPNLDTWVQKASLPATGRRGAIGFGIGNKGYIGCGTDLFNFYKDFYEYDVSTDTWTQKTNYPGSGTYGNLCTSSQDKGYVGWGSVTFFTQVSDFWEYNPSTGIWSSKASTTASGFGGATGIYLGSKVYAASGSGSSELWEYSITGKSIKLGTVSSSICEATPFSVPYTIGCSAFNTGNTFTLQLSNQFGVFDNPTTIGTITSTGSGTITATIPAGTVGTNYRMRIVGSNPLTYSLINENDIAIRVKPTVGTTVSPNSTVCQGTMVTLSGTGANTYSWSNGITNATAFAANTLGNTTYTVTGTAANGCTSAASQIITVNARPTVGTNVSIASPVCQGNNVTLTGTGASTYSWNNGVTNGVAFVANTLGSTTYTVTGTNANGCSNTATRTITVSAVPTTPTITTASATTFCSGGSVILNTSTIASNEYFGCFFKWYRNGTLVSTSNYITKNNQGIVTNSYTATIAGNYTVTATHWLSIPFVGYAEDCTSQLSAPTVVTVNPLPTVTANASAINLCEGSQLTLTGGGANTYTWNNGVTNGVAFTASTVGSTTYTVIGTDANGCTNSANRSVLVTSRPTTPNITAASTTIFCSGGSVILNTSSIASSGYSGCVFRWYRNGTLVSTSSYLNKNNQGIVTNSYTASIAGSYTVTATNWRTIIFSGPIEYCTSQLSAPTVVTINTLPTAAINTSNTNLSCTTPSLTLTATGGTSYQWNGTGNNATTAGITAASAGTYTVTVTNVEGCTATASSVITSNQTPPNATITAPASACINNSINLSVADAGVGSTYVWTGNGINNINNNITTATPTSFGTQNYSVLVTGANGCTASSTIQVNISNSAIWYQDFDGDGYGNASISQNVCTQPIGYVANNTDCNDNDNTANVLPIASVIAASSATTFCETDSIILTGNIGGVWSNGSTASSITVFAAGDYFVTNTTNCSSVTSNHIIITTNPATSWWQDADGDGDGNQFVVTIACTQPAGYVANSDDCNDADAFYNSSLVWYIDADGDGFGSSAQTYTGCDPGSSMFVLNSLDCDDSNNLIQNSYNFYIDADADGIGAGSLVSVCAIDALTPPNGYSLTNTDCNDNNNAVQSAPTTSVISANGSTNICSGSSVTLVGNTGGVWNTGATSASITVNTAGTYSVTTSNACGTVTSNAIVVVVNTNPAPTIIGDASFCPTSSAILTTTQNYAAYQWSNSSTASTITVTQANTYTVNVMDVNGCTGSASVTINACAGVGPQGSFPTNQCGYLTNLQSGSMYCNATTGATGYLVKFYTINSNTVYAQKTISTNSVTFTNLIPALQDGSQYDVTVTPIMLSGASGVESEKCRMGIIASQTPSNIAACSLSSPACVANASSAPVLSNTSSIRCSAVIQASTYQFRFENVANPSEVVLAYQSAPRVRTLAPLNLTAGATYAVSVRATVAGVQASNFGSVCYIKMAAPATRESGQEFMIEDLKFNISVSPNPINDNTTIFISSNEDEEANVVLTDITGKVVFTINIATNTNSEFRIQNSELQSGIYFVTATIANGERKTIKVVKQ